MPELQAAGRHPPSRALRADAFHSLVVDLLRPPRARDERCAPRWQDGAPWLAALAPQRALALEGVVDVFTLPAGQALPSRPGWVGVIEGCLSVATAAGQPPWGLPSRAWHGEQELLLGSRFRPRITAAVTSRVALLPAELFQQLLAEHPALAGWVLQMQARRLAALQQRLAWPRRPAPDAAVALWLAESFAAVDSDGHCRVPLTQAALARQVGLSRQRTNAALNRLRHLGELELAYGDIRLRQPARLAERALRGDFDELPTRMTTP